jgi:Ca-activated chloride channel family protein
MLLPNSVPPRVHLPECSANPMTVTHRSFLVATVALAAAAGAAAPSGRAEPARAALCSDDAMLVFDASSSMARLTNGGGTRIAEAREAARRVVPAATRARRLGLVVYGPGAAPDSCANVSLRVPPGPDTAGRIMAEIEAVEIAGPTPLTRSIEIAAETLSSAAGPAVVVLLTDGDETCGGDPCAAARRLQSRAPGLTVHVVGFMLGTFARFRAACLAEETGGLFIPAQSFEELEDALEKTLTCPDVASADADRTR